MENKPKGLRKSKIAKDKISEKHTVDSKYITQEDLEDLRKIFEQSLQSLEMQDFKSTKMLLNGVIHECDRILRLSDVNDSKIPCTAEFYFIYGSALHKLCLLLIDEEDYNSEKDVFYQLELSSERLIQSREAFNSTKASQTSNEMSLMFQIQLELSQVYSEQYNYSENKEEAYLRFEEQTEVIAQSIISKSSEKKTIENLVYVYMDFLRNHNNIKWPSHYEKITSLIIKNFEKFQSLTNQSQNSSRVDQTYIKFGRSIGHAYKGLYFMYKASDLFDCKSQTSNENETPKTIVDMLEEQIIEQNISTNDIVNWLNKAISLLNEINFEDLSLQPSEAPDDFHSIVDIVYTLKIECLLNKQLTIIDEEHVEYKELTQQIIKNLKEAKSLLKNHMPDTLQNILDSYE